MVITFTYDFVYYTSKIDCKLPCSSVGDPDPDPCQNVTDPQHCLSENAVISEGPLKVYNNHVEKNIVRKVLICTFNVNKKLYIFIST